MHGITAAYWVVLLIMVVGQWNLVITHEGDQRRLWLRLLLIVQLPAFAGLVGLDVYLLTGTAIPGLGLVFVGFVVGFAWSAVWLRRCAQPRMGMIGLALLLLNTVIGPMILAAPLLPRLLST